MKWFMVFAGGLALSVGSASAEYSCACGDAGACAPGWLCEHPPRAPAGVTGDHVHHKGGWMASYRYLAMHMEGVDGGDVSGYMMRPVEMDMQMHMVGAMMAPHDRITIALMVPYIIKDMDMERGPMSIPFSERTEGVGDVRLAGIVDLRSTEVHQFLFNIAVSLPTGSIDEENSAGNRLGYPLQLGSGSYGLIPGITYTGFAEGWGWGAQAKAAVPLDRNKHGYRLGNRYDLQGWLLRDLCSSSAASLRLNAWHRENIDGDDSALNPVMSPGNDPDRRAATRLDLLAGIDWRLGFARFTLEGGVPLYQDLDGPQLEGDWMLFAGVQLSF